jgi:hypothetical protein
MRKLRHDRFHGPRVTGGYAVSIIRQSWKDRHLREAREWIRFAVKVLRNARREFDE